MQAPVERSITKKYSQERSLRPILRLRKTGVNECEAYFLEEESDTTGREDKESKRRRDFDKETNGAVAQRKAHFFIINNHASEAG